jgi:hypothetical protein
MTPEDMKTLKVMLATFKFEITETFEKKVDELLKEKKRPKVEVGYR